MRLHLVAGTDDVMHEFQRLAALLGLGQQQRQRFKRALWLELDNDGLFADHRGAQVGADPHKRLVGCQHLRGALQPVAAHRAA